MQIVGPFNQTPDAKIRESNYLDNLKSAMAGEYMDQIQDYKDVFNDTSKELEAAMQKIAAYIKEMNFDNEQSKENYLQLLASSMVAPLLEIMSGLNAEMVKIELELDILRKS